MTLDAMGWTADDVLSADREHLLILLAAMLDGWMRHITQDIDGSYDASADALLIRSTIQKAQP